MNFKKGLILATFLLYGLKSTVAVILDATFISTEKLEDSFYYDITHILGVFFLSIGYVIFVLQDRRLPIIYKFLSVAILLFVFWDTIYYYLYILIGKIDINYAIIENLTYWRFITYGVWKANLYKTKRK
jgi:hypothetical protein